MRMSNSELEKLREHRRLKFGTKEQRHIASCEYYLEVLQKKLDDFCKKVNSDASYKEKTELRARVNGTFKNFKKMVEKMDNVRCDFQFSEAEITHWKQVVEGMKDKIKQAYGNANFATKPFITPMKVGKYY